MIATFFFANHEPALAAKIVSMTEIGISMVPKPVMVCNAPPYIKPCSIGFSTFEMFLEGRFGCGIAALSSFCSWRDNDVSYQVLRVKGEVVFGWVFAILVIDPPRYLARRQVTRVMNNNV